MPSFNDILSWDGTALRDAGKDLQDAGDSADAITSLPRPGPHRRSTAGGPP